VKLIEFPVSFADRVDLDLPRKLRAELPGILNWAIAGCLAWQREGLNPPLKVQVDTQSYRKEQDLIGQFISECCQTGEDYMQCKAAALYAAYRRWAEASDSPTVSQRRFGNYLTAHGYPSDNNATGRGALRRKIGLNTLPGDEDEDATEADKTATLRQGRVAATNASNGAAKPASEGQDATLATLGFRNPHEENPLYRVSGSKGSKGSNSPHNKSHAVEKEGDAAATLPNAKGSTPAPARGSTGETVSPSYCPGCARNSTWLLRDEREVCYKCGTQKPHRPEGMR
jgi:hypothetical protein